MRQRYSKVYEMKTVLRNKKKVSMKIDFYLEGEFSKLIRTLGLGAGQRNDEK